MAVSVFALPYLFPPSQHLLSASALAGFNNTVAYVLYAVTLIVSASLVARVIPRPTWPGPEAGGRLFLLPSAAVILVLAGHVALFAWMYRRQGGFLLAEALYFEDTAYRAIAGAVPFIDFTFFYGPLLLYPTVWLGRAFGLLPGYALAFGLQYLAGLYLLWIVLAALLGDRRRATLWFAGLAIGFFNPYLGLNYTWLRFMLPLTTLVAAWRCTAEPTPGAKASVVLLLTVTLLCSPDMAIVSSAGLGVMWTLTLLLGDSRERTRTLGLGFSLTAVALVVAAGLLFLIDGSWRPAIAYLAPVVTFAAGGWNTQIDPSVPMITLLGLTVLMVAWFWSAWQQPGFRERRPLLAAYFVMALLMQRASFGKADVVHIVYSGLPVLLATIAWAGERMAPAVRRNALAAVLLVGLALPLQFYDAMLFVPSLLKRLAAQDEPTASAAPAPSKQTIQAGIARAVEHFGRDRLYYMHLLEYYRLPIYLQFQLKPFMYQPSLTAAFTPEDIQHVIRQLRDSQAVVLSRRADLSPEPPKLLPTAWPFAVTGAPLPGSTVFNLTLEFQSRLERPLLEFLSSDAYITRFTDGDLVGLELRTATTPHAVQ